VIAPSLPILLIAYLAAYAFGWRAPRSLGSAIAFGLGYVWILLLEGPLATAVLAGCSLALLMYALTTLIHSSDSR
jgi:hypothetical protein